MFLLCTQGYSMLYFIRHGQTDANLKRINAGGEFDVPLNANGMAQARAFAAANQDFIASLDAVFVSPMTRARQTMELVLEGHNKPIEIIEDLREWMLGAWSGVSYDQTPHLFSTDAVPEGGESRPEFFRRTLKAMQHVEQRHDGKVLIVAHGGVWYSYAKHAAHPNTDLDNCAHEEICRRTLRGIQI
jgi:probable phosphoglycerate mutase